MTKNIAENFNRLSRAHERYRQTTNRQTTDKRATAYSEHERKFTFAKNEMLKCELRAHYLCVPCSCRVFLRATIFIVEGHVTWSREPVVYRSTHEVSLYTHRVYNYCVVKYVVYELTTRRRQESRASSTRRADTWSWWAWNLEREFWRRFPRCRCRWTLP